jgi:hypothetical protein
MKKEFWIDPIILTPILLVLEIGCNKEEYVKSCFLSTTLEAPIVETLAATNISSTGATLNGRVDAMGITTRVAFDYSFFNDQWFRVPACTVTGNSTSSVSANVFLRCFGSNYCIYRVVAENFYGISYGCQMGFSY